jgi:hypothetical protein
MELGNILPDWTGGFNLNVSYKNFTLSSLIDFQKGGLFYSISKMFGAYSGLTDETVGNNLKGNPIRDPLTDANGNAVAAIGIPLASAGSNSGGIYVKAHDANGNEVEYLVDPLYHFGNLFYIKENWLFDASYVKLKNVTLTYNLPTSMLSNLPVKRASVALDLQNPLLLYAATSGVDPSAIQNGTAGFSFWEGGVLPGTRSVGFNVNLSF